MQRVNAWRPPCWFRTWMLWSTRAGDGWLWYAIAGGLLLTGGKQALRPVAAAGAAMSAGVALFIAGKRIFRRRRPGSFEAHSWVALLPPDQFSFPSGHSISAFAFTTALGLYYPAAWPALGFCAASVALSRVVLGMHFSSDVLVGSALGAALGYLAHLVF